MFSKNTGILILILIFVVSFFIRWYRISDYLFFGYEQGRDAFIIAQIYKLQDFVLVGPSTSIGGLFHGPWYYYMMAFPYGLSGGNPLSASLFLIALGSLVPVVVFLFAADIFKSKIWGGVCSILIIFSFEYILYARWLSNVSPAPLFIALSFFMLWKYINIQKKRNFLGFVLFSSIASLFQMILIPQFLFVLFLLFVFKQLKLPEIKIVVFSVLIILVQFSPLILFDLRNENITLNSLINFSREASESDDAALTSGIKVYFLQLYHHLVLSVLYIKYFPFQILLIATVFWGSVLGYIKGNKKAALFLISWVLMTLPLIKISSGNPQYYVGAGLGCTLLFCFSMKNLLEVKYFRFAPSIFGLAALISFYLTFSSLNQNKDIFFRTTQEDLVYSDQLELIRFVNTDSKSEPYKFAAFTIPSLHPEGWEYLHNYYYLEAKTQNAKLIYIVIEKDVYPVWEEKWINDFGKTKLVFEKKFGLLRLQKREIID